MRTPLLALLALAACAHAPPSRPQRESPAPVDAVPALASTPAPAGDLPAAPSPVPPAAEGPEALLGRLSLEQKVGQLLMVGFGGLAVDEKIEALVRGYQVGGVCLFKRNIESSAQVAVLNDQVRALLAGGVPPFIAVDQEGGNVVRVSDRVVVLPGNMALGATRDASLAYEAAKAQALDLKRLGFNMNLAPVLDVNSNPANPVIGTRSVSDSAALVSELGQALVRGQQDANLATIAKHFPGHGSVDADSHRALPRLLDDEAALLEHLLPFRGAMDSGLDGVMTAHLSVPRVAGDETPATLSAPILTGLLREKLGFQGLVLTDELEMQAIAERYGVGRAAVLAVNAGADMVLVPWRAEKKAEVREALLEAARSGVLPRARLDEAVRRVLALKLRRGVFEPLPPLAARLQALGPSRALGFTIARRAVTLLKSDARHFPLSPARKVVVITAESTLADAVLRRSPLAKVVLVPAYPPEPSRNALKLQVREAVQGADEVVVGVVNARQVELVTNASLSGVPVLAVVMGLPYLASAVSEASAVLLTYSARDTASEAAAASLFGEQGTPGRLPVALPRMPFGSGLDPVGKRLKAPPPPKAKVLSSAEPRSLR